MRLRVPSPQNSLSPFPGRKDIESMLVVRAGPLSAKIYVTVNPAGQKQFEYPPAFDNRPSIMLSADLEAALADHFLENMEDAF
jgi:hypothetical protein